MKITPLYIFLIIFQVTVAQDSLHELLDNYNNETIPYINVDDLKTLQNDVILLDAREQVEYDVSHIKKAIHVGYNLFSIDSLASQNIPKDKTIVVYCSLGVRSEDISEKLKKAGYENVFNLYGGIFEWKNRDLPVVNSEDEITDEVHACSKEWAKWLLKGKKVYSN
ncbi:rhodanese-like domain-containing protein [Aquimarina sp. MMG016]|uniref:rhodanese-like domain-containing protein n=1 Tax=Aquimarina sp. MMG016 TaxID=2822690 RepID=UPI001B39F5E6|nr:rhodanese-like domain-containing protein [Aquimarina sp. MMG016]MBQ4820833.1 rhodanese-like domain-containing protein [Aquimarina sp. MMG016]